MQQIDSKKDTQHTFSMDKKNLELRPEQGGFIGNFWQQNNI